VGRRVGAGVGRGEGLGDGRFVWEGQETTIKAIRMKYRRQRNEKSDVRYVIDRRGASSRTNFSGDKGPPEGPARSFVLRVSLTGGRVGLGVLGILVGRGDGLGVGEAVGRGDGIGVGPGVGDGVGLGVGCLVGFRVGDGVGLGVGLRDGEGVYERGR